MLQAILLAAGLSKRFGDSNKLLHSMDGKAMFLHTLFNLHQAKLGKIILVTGLDREEILSNIPPQISYQEVYNPKFKNGMTSSIQAAVEASAIHVSGYMICLADQIKLKPKSYEIIGKAYAKLYLKDQQAILIPSYQNQNGNPVVLSSNYRKDILKLKSTNGCKPIVMGNKQHVYTLDIDDPGLKYDIDTQADLD